MIDGEASDERREALRTYLLRWSPVSWRGRLDVSAPRSADDELAEILNSLSAIETDSRVIARKVRAARIDRQEELHQFLIVWQAEESEHGRIFEQMAVLYGVDRSPVSRNSIGILNRVVMPIVGLIFPRIMCAAYCSQGALQEYIALQTYLFISDLVPDLDVREILRDIARQESRHMKFYLTCANSYLRGSVVTQAAVRLILSVLWAPPGVDILGDSEFRRIARPLFQSHDYRAKMLSVDNFANRLVGLDRLQLMDRWLRRDAA